MLLEQHTASNSATLDFTACISSAYDEYRIEFVALVPATNNVDLWLLVSTDGGSTFDSTSGHYDWATMRWIYTGGASSAGNGGDTKLVAATGSGEHG